MCAAARASTPPHGASRPPQPARASPTPRRREVAGRCHVRHGPYAPRAGAPQRRNVPTPQSRPRTSYSARHHVARGTVRGARRSPQWRQCTPPSVGCPSQPPPHPTHTSRSSHAARSQTRHPVALARVAGRAPQAWHIEREVTVIASPHGAADRPGDVRRPHDVATLPLSKDVPRTRGTRWRASLAGRSRRE